MRIFYSFFEIMLRNKLNIISQTKHSCKNKTDIDFNYNKFNYNVTPSTKIYFYSSHFPYPPFYSHDFTFENYEKCSDDINISIIDLPKTHSALEGASSPEKFVFKFNKPGVYKMILKTNNYGTLESNIKHYHFNVSEEISDN